MTSEPARPESAARPVVPGYDVLRRIGAGGMGVVHLAKQQATGRLVALKLLPAAVGDDPVLLQRFRREIAALERCDHPNVVRILDAGEADVPWYAMDLVDGADLASVARAFWTSGDLDRAVATASAQAAARAGLQVEVPDSTATAAIENPTVAAGTDPLRRLAALVRDAARGLHYLHERGIVHRDVKPSNVMVTRRDHRPVITDLGAAALAAATRTLSAARGSVIGTLRYMPPEQLRGDAATMDRQVDVYALGATLHELLTGRPFLDADSDAALIQAVLTQEPRPPRALNPEVPTDLDLIVRMATSKDRERRYRTAAAFANDLDAFLEGRAIAARPPTLAYVLRLAARRHPRVIAALVAGASLIVIGAGLFTLYQRATLARERSLRVEASAARDEARSRLRTARSLALAGASQQALGEGDMTLALLLAREAVARDRTLEAARALRDAVQYPFHEVAILSGHAGPLTTARFSPDGALVLTAATDGTARTWEPSGQSVRVLQHGPSTTARWSPDGVRLLTSGGEVVKVWSVDGRLLAELPHDAGVQAAEWSPDGSTIGTATERGDVRAWHAGGGLLRLLGSHERTTGRIWVYSLAFSPDGGRVVTTSADSTVRTWRLDGGASRVLRGHPAWPWQAEFSPDGRRIASVGFDPHPRLWDAASGRLLATLEGSETNELHAVAFAPDGSHFVTGTVNGTLDAWSPDGRLLGVMPDACCGMTRLSFSADGRHLVGAFRDGAARVWTSRGALVAALRDDERGSPMLSWSEATDASFSPEADQVVVATPDGTARVYSRKDATPRRGCPDCGGASHATADRSATRFALVGIDKVVRIVGDDFREVTRFPRDEHAGRAFLSPDGERLVITRRGLPPRLWRADGTFVAELAGHEEVINSVAFADDSRRLVTTGGGSLRTWDMDGRVLLTRDGWNATFLPDSHDMALIDADGRGVRLDAEGRLLATYAPRGSGRALLPSPDARRLLMLEMDATATLWTFDGEEIAELEGHERAHQVSAAWSQDGRSLVTWSTDRTARTWTSEGQPLAVFPGHENAITVAALSSGGRLLTAAAGTSRVWDATGRLLDVIEMRGAVSGAWFSADGRRLLTADSGGSLREWIVDADDLLRLARAQCVRDLSASERERYRELLGGDGPDAGRVPASGR